MLRKLQSRGYLKLCAVTEAPTRPIPGPTKGLFGGAKPSRAFVIVLAGDRMGESIELDPAYTTIGRGLTATVRINDEGISRIHATITADQGVYYLSDAGSTNGTFADGHRVDKYPLREGDKIQLGAASILRFTYQDDPDPNLQHDLYQSTLRDRLTGMFTRSYLENRLESDVAVALRHGKPLALSIFSLDNLPELLAKHGQANIDQVHRDVARTVQEITRSDDLLASHGPEFFHLCRDVDAMRAARAARRILATPRSNRPSLTPSRRVRTPPGPP